MHSLSALNSDQIGKIGIGAIVAVVVIGLLLGMIISAIVGRIIILVIVVALGAYIWQQRASIEDHVNKCHLNMSFFGVNVNAPADVIQQCKEHQKSK
jgi:uncharacterized membrane protein